MEFDFCDVVEAPGQLEGAVRWPGRLGGVVHCHTHLGVPGRHALVEEDWLRAEKVKTATGQAWLYASVEQRKTIPNLGRQGVNVDFT